ncbi:hypothetical protein [Catenulispora yoronensis]
MANHEGVRVDVAGILRQLEDNGFDDVRVEFVSQGTDESTVLDVAGRGVAVANDVAAERIWGAAPTASIAGVSVKLMDLSDLDAVAVWLEAFVGELRAGGLSGEIGATPLVRLPEWISQLAEPMVTAYVALAAPALGVGAGAGGTADDWCERAVEWASEAGGEAYLSSAGMNQLDTSKDVAAHLSSVLRASSSGALRYADEGASRAAFVQIGPNGQAVYQVHDPSAPQTVQVERARAAIIAEAAQAHFAFVAPTPHQAYAWDARSRALPPLRPEVTAAALRGHAELWSRLVPDAHGIQLLTQEHMGLVSDLSQWTVIEVTPGRFVVEAPDLTEWLRPEGPANSTLDKARADFGRALASVDDLR